MMFDVFFEGAFGSGMASMDILGCVVKRLP